MSSADGHFEWEFPEHHQDHMDMFEKEWEGHFAGTTDEAVDEKTARPTHFPSTGPANAEHLSTGENGVFYAVVKVWINDDIEQYGPRQRVTDYIHVSDPDLYAPIPEANSAENATVETLFPTEDEDETKRWKLVPRSACVQYDQYWACFNVKWQESVDEPAEFSLAITKGPGVVDCKVEVMTEDDNKHRLLLVTMLTLEGDVENKIDLWGKRIVGNEEYTLLTKDEKSYVWFEEQKRVV
ncbi:hypothetical protein JMJ35_004242 [Cladonia borealis]|uniref:Uncharacterized protein n=1 Tax=Cladonia borealis TaxID=184061 RepID=A0AA39R396_9LECA|nr:hypothetical protein JMJ35_004242 [Cladonia borealis]